jgi:chemotaxis family two-component system response regulator Rcp1
MPTIFLVEDNAADVDLFRMALQDACVECDLVLFEDGSEVIDHVRKSDSASLRSAPDLIVLDLNLPKSDGLEVLQVIRDAPGFAQVPVAVLSSSSSARERAKLAAFHIREFIVKSPDIEEYLNIGKIVRNLLNETKPQHGAVTHKR